MFLRKRSSLYKFFCINEMASIPNCWRNKSRKSIFFCVSFFSNYFKLLQLLQFNFFLKKKNFLSPFLALLLCQQEQINRYNLSLSKLNLNNYLSFLKQWNKKTLFLPFLFLFSSFYYYNNKIFQNLLQLIINWRITSIFWIVMSLIKNSTIPNCSP